MEAKRQLDVLNRHLGGVDGTGGGPYICGEEYTIADMAVTCGCLAGTEL